MKKQEIAMLLKLAEECSELSAELLKYVNKNKPAGIDKIKSECSDVEKHLKQVIMLLR